MRSRLSVSIASMRACARSSSNSATRARSCISRTLVSRSLSRPCILARENRPAATDNAALMSRAIARVTKNSSDISELPGALETPLRRYVSNSPRMSVSSGFSSSSVAPGHRLKATMRRSASGPNALRMSHRRSRVRVILSVESPILTTHTSPRRVPSGKASMAASTCSGQTP